MAFHNPHSYAELIDKLNRLELDVAEVAESAKSLKLPDDFETKLLTVRATLVALQRAIKSSSEYRMYPP